MQSLGVNLGYLVTLIGILVLLLALVVIGLRAIKKYINKD